MRVALDEQAPQLHPMTRESVFLRHSARKERSRPTSLQQDDISLVLYFYVNYFSKFVSGFI